MSPAVTTKRLSRSFLAAQPKALRGLSRLPGDVCAMRFLLMFTLACGLVCAAESRNLLANATLQPGAAGDPEGWSYWSPRADLAQEHAVVARDGANTVMLRSRDFTQYGYWLTRVTKIEAGKFYQFEALHQAEGMREDDGGGFAGFLWYFDRPSPRQLPPGYIHRQE